MAVNYQDTLDMKSHERYMSKIKVSHLSEFPYKLPEGT